MADVTTTPNGTSITYPPYAGYGMGGGNNNQAVWRAEEFLAFLQNQQVMNEGFHHILAREAQIQTDIAAAEGAVQSAISASQNAVQGQSSTYALGNANSQAQYALAAQNQASQLGIQAAQNFGNTQNDIATAREQINLQVRQATVPVNAGTLARLSGLRKPCSYRLRIT